MKPRHFFRFSFFPKAVLFFFLIFFMILPPVYASGEKIAILVNSKQRDESTTRMVANLERDLRNFLILRGKYDVRILGSLNEPKKEGEYLLFLNILKYYAGDKAGDVLGELEARSSTLVFHYELINTQGEKILSVDDNYPASPEVPKIARKINENIFSKIHSEIAKGSSVQNGKSDLSAVSQGNEQPPEIEKIADPLAAPYESQEAGGTASEDDSAEVLGMAEEIRKLVELRSAGQISEEEYENKSLEIQERMTAS